MLQLTGAETRSCERETNLCAQAKTCRLIAEHAIDRSICFDCSRCALRGNILPEAERTPIRLDHFTFIVTHQF